MTKETELQDQDKKQGAADKKVPVQKKDQVEQTSTGSSGGWLMGLVFILLLGAMGGFFWMGQQDHIKAQKKVQFRLQKELTQLQQSFDSLKAGKSTGVAPLQKELLLLQQQQEVSEREFKKLSSVISISGDRVHLHEARYLLYIANQQLQFNRDIDSAIAALEKTDGLLLNEKDPSLLPVRKKIARELLTLRSLDQADIESTAIRLIAIGDSVSRLPLNKDIRVAEFKLNGSAFNMEDVDLTDWELVLERIWAEFRKLLVIQHKDEVAIPMLMIENEYLLRNNLQLKLEMMRVALLNNQQDLYKASINTAIRWIELYFDLTDTQVIAVKGELDQFKALNINPAFPDISGSLKLLRAQIDQTAQGVQ
ncbi:MAG: hypothetical protein GXP22_10190 [Gammaproteobacteria bacterium]|nr:hypothetical protein [Gammaproteobacteria bacterium]